MQLELERFKRWYYGPCADRLQSLGDLAQLLFNFAEELERKPIQPDDVASQPESQEEQRRVKRRKGRRNLAELRKSPRHHSHSRVEPSRACLSVLRPAA